MWRGKTRSRQAFAAHGAGESEDGGQRKRLETSRAEKEDFPGSESRFTALSLSSSHRRLVKLSGLNCQFLAEGIPRWNRMRESALDDECHAERRLPHWWRGD
jgi:hypothetical protein